MLLILVSSIQYPVSRKMTEQEKQTFKTKLLETITSTEAKIEDLKEATKPIAPENAIGRISRMDAINNKSVSEAALRIARRKLAKLQHALTKMDEPDFGNCSNCGKPIQVKRLMFMPQSTQCVRCAR